MLVIYNGECYDKNTLLSHLNKVVEQIESVEDVEIPDEHKSCCLAKTCQRNCNKCCSFHSNVEAPVHHCCEGNHHCSRYTSPVSCGIKEVCEREECSNCHHHIQPTVCHHHPDRKCITIRDKPKPQPCPCCRGCVKNPCVFVPQICKNNETKASKCKTFPCITFPENEKISSCKDRGDNFKCNPFIINESKNRTRNSNQSKNQVVIQSSPLKKCNCENCHCIVKCEESKPFDLCACNRTNGLQDNCKLCHMPRGRLGYLKTNK